MATKGMTRRQDRRGGRQQRRQDRRGGRQERRGSGVEFYRTNNPQAPTPGTDKRQKRRGDRQEVLKVQVNEGYTADDVRYKANQMKDEMEQFRSGFRRPG